MKKLSGLFGHQRKDLRRRGVAGDQRRYPPKRRLLVRQKAQCLL
jgi:hypothetical protein